MAIIQGNAKQGSTRGFYPKVINGSLRFNDDDSAYLSWTPTSSGSQQKFTWSGWVKIGSQAASKSSIFASGGGGSNVDFYRNSSGALTFEYYNGATNYYEWTNAVYRDPSAWYHIVLAIDTTLASADNRVRLYINGDEVTSYLYNVTPAQNFNYPINTSSYTMKLGVGAQYTSGYYDGYMANVQFVDGQQLTPSDFGETKNGVWVAKDYAGTFGTNGFYLTFEDDTQVEAFNTVLYRGNAGLNQVTGVGFQPDLIWVKQRGSTNSHGWVDAVRGPTKALASNLTDSEYTYSNGIQSFDSDGFTINGNNGWFNSSTNKDYVAWCWKAGDSNVSNTVGTITSTVRANPTYGFSIIDLNTPASGSFTVGHGLSSAPDFIILKRRDAGLSNWVVGHTSMGWDKYMFLQSTAAQASSTTAWSNTAPTSSVINLDSSFYGGSANYICYCWSETTGYSKFGSYTGTGTTTGNTVTLGFRPAFLLIKRTDTASTNGWYIWDGTRNVGDYWDTMLYANLSNGDDSGSSRAMNVTDTTFQPASTDSNYNASGGTYIYAAFADTREAAFWLDQSGNDNDWQPVNLDHNDTVADSPTNNFATWNPLTTYSGGTYSDGNLKVITGTTQYGPALSTIAVSSGKYYVEFTQGSGSYTQIGCVSADASLSTTTGVESSAAQGFCYVQNVGSYRSEGSVTSGYGSSWTSGDVIGVALNLDDNQVTFYKNGVSQGVKSITGGRTYYFAVSDNDTGTGTTVTANFGQQPFKYDPPA